MNLTINKHRLLFSALATAIFLILSTCSPSSTEESGDINNMLDSLSEQQSSEQEGFVPANSVPDDNDQSATDLSGNGQNDVGASNTATQPNTLLVITYDQGIEASAQFSFSNDLFKYTGN